MMDIYINNAKKKMSLLFSLLLMLLSPFIMGISAYLISRVSVSAAFTVDIYDPQLIVESVLGEDKSSPIYVTEKEITIYGSAMDTGSGIKNLSINGEETLLGTDGKWSTTVTLQENSLTEIKVTATDYAGKTISILGYVMCDLTSPKLIVKTPEGTATNPTETQENYIIVSGTAEDFGSGIRNLTVNETEVEVINGSWSTRVNLTVGTVNEIMIKAIDYAGNSSTEVRYATISGDTTPPNIYIDTLSNNPVWDIVDYNNKAFTSTNGTYTLYGQVTDDKSGVKSVTIGVYKSYPISDFVDLGEAVIDSNGNWSFTITTGLELGSNYLQVLAEDNAGNISTEEGYVNYNDGTLNASYHVQTLDGVEINKNTGILPQKFKVVLDISDSNFKAGDDIRWGWIISISGYDYPYDHNIVSHSAEGDFVIEEEVDLTILGIPSGTEINTVNFYFRCYDADDNEYLKWFGYYNYVAP